MARKRCEKAMTTKMKFEEDTGIEKADENHGSVKDKHEAKREGMKTGKMTRVEKRDYEGEGSATTLTKKMERRTPGKDNNEAKGKEKE